MQSCRPGRRECANGPGFEESADCSAVRYESASATEIKIYFSMAHCDIFIAHFVAVQIATKIPENLDFPPCCIAVCGFYVSYSAILECSSLWHSCTESGQFWPGVCEGKSAITRLWPGHLTELS